MMCSFTWSLLYLTSASPIKYLSLDLPGTYKLSCVSICTLLIQCLELVFLQTAQKRDFLLNFSGQPRTFKSAISLHSLPTYMPASPHIWWAFAMLSVLVGVMLSRKKIRAAWRDALWCHKHQWYWEVNMKSSQPPWAACHNRQLQRA